MSRFALVAASVVYVAALMTAMSGCASSGDPIWLAPMEPRSPMYTAVSPSAAVSQEILNATPICCDALSGLAFAPLDRTQVQFFPIGARSQAFAFATGKSLVQGIVIPDDLERTTIDLDAVAGATVFVPTVLILDRDFKVSRAIDSRNFRYAPAGFLEPQRLHGGIHLDRRPESALAGEKYLVVFTTDKDLRGSTKMIGEARLYARSRGLSDPRIPNPVAEHAATGVLRVRVGELEDAAPSAARYSAQQKRATRYLAPAGTAVSAASPETRPRRGERSRPDRSPGPQTLSEEAQALYDRMIRGSVASGDTDRAWRLVQEAERAGSTGARRTFLDAVGRK